MNTPFWNDPAVVGKAPIAATLLLESANVEQLIQMWTHHTAAGQSLSAWWSVCLALVLYYQFYRIVLPEQKWAKRMAAVGICMNLLVTMSVLYFRATGRG